MLRVAFMIPQLNATLEPESYQLVPPTVSIHFARLQGSLLSEETSHRLNVGLKVAWNSLVDIAPQVVGFACTAGSFYHGRAYEEQLRQEMEELVQRPFITTSQAAVMAARALELKRLAVTTPYDDWLNKRLVTFLEEYELEVVAIQGMGLTVGISEVDLPTVGRFVEAADQPDAEGIFVSCTALRTVESIAAWKKVT